MQIKTLIVDRKQNRKLIVYATRPKSQAFLYKIQQTLLYKKQ